MTEDAHVELLSPKADVLDQTRLRPHNTGLRYSHDGKIVSLLLNLKSQGKADLTVKFVSDRLKYLSRFVDLDDAGSVNLFISRKQCNALHKDARGEARGTVSTATNSWIEIRALFANLLWRYLCKALCSEPRNRRATLLPFLIYVTENQHALQMPFNSVSSADFLYSQLKSLVAAPAFHSSDLEVVENVEASLHVFSAFPVLAIGLVQRKQCLLSHSPLPHDIPLDSGITIVEVFF